MDDPREFANASQPDILDRAVFSSYMGGAIPVSEWQKELVPADGATTETEQGDRPFGTHIREAAEVLRGVLRRR